MLPGYLSNACWKRLFENWMIIVTRPHDTHTLVSTWFLRFTSFIKMHRIRAAISSDTPCLLKCEMITISSNINAFSYASFSYGGAGPVVISIESNTRISYAHFTWKIPGTVANCHIAYYLRAPFSDSLLIFISVKTLWHSILFIPITATASVEFSLSWSTIIYAFITWPQRCLVRGVKF